MRTLGNGTVLWGCLSALSDIRAADSLGWHHVRIKRRSFTSQVTDAAIIALDAGPASLASQRPYGASIQVAKLAGLDLLRTTCAWRGEAACSRCRCSPSGREPVSRGSPWPNRMGEMAGETPRIGRRRYWRMVAAPPPGADVAVASRRPGLARAPTRYHPMRMEGWCRRPRGWGRGRGSRQDEDRDVVGAGFALPATRHRSRGRGWGRTCCVP